MPAKSESTAHQSYRAKLISNVRSFLSGLSDQSVIDAGVGLVIVVILSLFLIHYKRPQIEPMPAGTIASADIFAPADLKHEDVAETARRRTQATTAVLPVFDYTARPMMDARNSLESLFKTAHEAPPNISDDELTKRIEEASSLILELDQLSVLKTHGFNAEIEKLMVDHLEATMSRGITDSRSQMLKIGSSGIIRRDQKGGQEITITDLSSIHDLITARAALRSERLLWPPDFTPGERKILGDILGSLVIPNLIYNENETVSRKNQAMEDVTPASVSVEKGKLIVARGETITPIKALLIDDASRYRPIGQQAIEFAGTVIIVMVLLLVLWQYMLRFQHRHLRVRRHFLLQMTAFFVTLAIARFFFLIGPIIAQWAEHTPFKSDQGYQYLTPLAVGAVMVTLLTDSRAAFVFSAILGVFIGVLSGQVYTGAYSFIVSVAAIYCLKGCRDRTSLVRAGAGIGLANAAVALALDLLGASEPRIGILIFDMFCAFGGGMLSTMVASVLLPAFEWIFQITTDIKLLELSNLNLPLLKQLAERAPGTYHHSIMVGLLAEAAAEAVGADALFTRVACYYHDIGKMVRPHYFIENQSYMENLHDKLTPKMSSIVLANHVKQGLTLARQYKLPPRILSAIPEHHGTGLMKYFYVKARDAGETMDPATLEQEFRYPGPKPQNRETAIIMIADSIEAAARTIKEPTHGKLRNLTENTITRLRDDGQFDECDITLRQLRIAGEAIVKVLIGIYHHRIEYPAYESSSRTPEIEAVNGNGIDYKNADRETMQAVNQIRNTREGESDAKSKATSEINGTQSD